MELITIFILVCITWVLCEGAVTIFLYYYRPYTLFQAKECRTKFHSIYGEYVVYYFVSYRYYYNTSEWRRKTIRYFVEKSRFTQEVSLKRKIVWELVSYEQAQQFDQLVQQQKTSP